MRLMGRQATLSGPHTRQSHPGHEIYPSLLKGLGIRGPNEVWCGDITCVSRRRGTCFWL